MSRSKDVKCPYCNQWQEICHDDGVGYKDGELAFQECADCGVTFSFTTMISFDYDAYVCGCINCGPHHFELHPCYPKKYSRWQCRDCEHTEALTPEQMEELLKEYPECSTSEVTAIASSV